MINLELCNHYYTWNNKIVFLRGDWNTLWNGGECELLICEKKPFRTHLYENPFRTTEETIQITDKVLSEMKPIPINCESCIYCQDASLPIGRYAINGWGHSKNCDLKREIIGRNRTIPDGIALSPDCPCFSYYPLTKMTTAENETLEQFSKALFQSRQAWFIASNDGFPSENIIFSLLSESKLLYVLDYNEISDTDIEYNKKVNWSIHAWCEISTENNETYALRSIWDAVFFRSEGTAAICFLEANRLLFFPFGIPAGYYAFSFNQEDIILNSLGTIVPWHIEGNTI